jgi:hypothetical protein
MISLSLRVHQDVVCLPLLSSSIHRLTHFSGKSTLLKVLGGQVKSGYFEGTYQKHILLRGFELVSEKVKPSLLSSDLIDLGSQKGAIGFVRQHGAGTVIPTLTVYENLYYRTCLFSSKRDSADEIHKTCTSLLIRCGLENRKDVTVRPPSPSYCYLPPSLPHDLCLSTMTPGNFAQWRSTEEVGIPFSLSPLIIMFRLAIGMEVLANDSVIFMDEVVRYSPFLFSDVHVTANEWIRRLLIFRR